ncbi:beta-N-acetylhexosaminidase [Carboxylicivirga marina]|uniref:beta-N-acetylhexosaminidase n=1 Tax=Carboxylicivirga marina TaxID=2800988 RepID=A0ABS1HG83_9BACT|nr:beta-N-acetylhexosaminidase [Carboxylicivirga marina]MBK3516663.1 beta-N-acetylhexosaminidase [Carboxylicivirga marina]
MDNKLRLLILVVVTGFIVSCTTRECPAQSIEIIPYPNELVVGEGYVDLSHGFKVIGETMHTAYLTSELSKKGISVGQEAKIVFESAKEPNKLGEEGYRFVAKKKTITITANGDKGYFYGIQTLLQLVNEATVAAVEIEDVPAFGWRAYMLDESRYFHGETFVKQVLEQMAMLKMNVFHWHLTDDAGWRIEIKKYPLLTEVGSKRADSEIETWKSGKTSGEPHEGFYTQEQIKDIVKYASERNITIVPEFEMPGHSSAAIAAYTWLGTAGIDIDVPVKFGRHYDNYDITKPEVEQFVKDVLNELFELFPSKVIHIGGDEVGYKVWKESKHVQQYMKENGINTPADLQIAFTNKISKFIESKGRRMMGWNEIMGINIHKGFEEKKDDKEAETELAKNVVVHFWKGDIKLITDAAQKGYSIVNSLHTKTYLDYSYKNIDLKKAYDFNPIPNELDEKYHKNIYGLGCQMWSEWTPSNKDIERQTFPRIAAYAEVGWTLSERKNYHRFKEALPFFLERWKANGIIYGPVE